MEKTSTEFEEGPDRRVLRQIEWIDGRSTEIDLACVFTARHAPDLRYVAAWARWLWWTGSVWRVDERLVARDLARAICDEAALRSGGRGAQRVASARTVAAVLTLAMSDPVHARAPEDWDADPWLLNTPQGIVDLRTGVLGSPRREAALTKLTAVGPAPGDCSLWRSFLARVTGGDAELEAFLRRLAGYALTGSVVEHALFFLWGPGGNGKGVYANTLLGILGDYATTAPMDSFTATHTERHPTDLAMLRGARLVVSQETEEGKYFSESRIKALTGGDPISARFMRQDFFSFLPQFKLLIAGNHKPRLRNVDEAIRRRLHLVPLTQTIREEERDPDLAEKLKSEWPQILSWAVEGCREWQANRLQPPPSVQNETAGYLENEDAVFRWTEDRCLRGSQLVSTNGSLFASWREWATLAGEEVASMRWLGERLVAAGFERVKDVPGCRGRGFRGIGLAAGGEDPCDASDGHAG